MIAIVFKKIFKSLMIVVVLFASIPASSTTIYYSSIILEDAYMMGAMIHRIQDADGAFKCLEANSNEALRGIYCKRHFLNNSGSVINGKFIKFPKNKEIQSLYINGFINSYKFYKSIDYDKISIKFDNEYNKKS